MAEVENKPASTTVDMSALASPPLELMSDATMLNYIENFAFVSGSFRLNVRDGKQFEISWKYPNKVQGPTLRDAVYQLRDALKKYGG